MCIGMEKEHWKGSSRAAYMKIKEIKRNFQPRTGILKNAKGTMLTEPEEIKNQWKEYTEQLYQNNSGVKDEMMTVFDQEPDILKDEAIAAIKLLPNNKAPGSDNIDIRSVFVPIFKKGDAPDCGNYRTIALIYHASKIQGRLLPYIEREEQAGFRKGRGTRDIIADIRWIMENAKEYWKGLYLCSVDYSKTFDCIDHRKLWKTLKNMGVPIHLINLIKSIYEAMVRTEYGDTQWFRVEQS